MIELKAATIAAGDFLLEGISFRVEAGEYAVMMGKTGVGKTSILECVCGLRSLRAGQVWLKNVNVTGWSAADRQVGYVPQDLALFPNLNVEQHLAFGLKLRGYSRGVQQVRIKEIAELLGISGLLKRSVRGLSGGESQRVALGRALSFRPSVLVLDEPLSALDDKTRGATQRLLREIQRQTGVTVLHVTHREAEAEALADRWITIESDGGAARITHRTIRAGRAGRAASDSTRWRVEAGSTGDQQLG